MLDFGESIGIGSRRPFKPMSRHGNFDAIVRADEQTGGFSAFAGR